MREKEQLRSVILAKRKNHPNNQFREQAIMAHLELIIKNYNQNKHHQKNWHFYKKLGLYYPMLGEIDLLKLVAKYPNQITLPKIDGSKMHFAPYNLFSQLEPSAFSNIMQPKTNEKLLPSIIIIPALALSVQGDRLGFGKGYYDKYLAKFKTSNMIKIGVCQHYFLYNELPRGNHDLKLDYVITEKIIIKL